YTGAGLRTGPVSRWPAGRTPPGCRHGGRREDIGSFAFSGVSRPGVVAAHHGGPLGKAGSRPGTRGVSLSYIVRTDSVLASTAAELRERHRQDGGACPACGLPAPCPAAR